MESQQKQVIHLYEFQQQSINEKQLSKQILDSLQPYFNNQTPPQIKIIGRPHKYWAYFQIEPQLAQKLNQLKTVQIGDSILNIGRYYYDYQIFINKLDPKITREQVIQYFQQFGDVLDIVITDPADKKKEEFKHCYIKMKDQKTIDRVVLAKIHKIQDRDVKPVRTFGLEEDKESDKKLFLKIQRLEGTPASIQQFEQNAIQFFMKHGKLRERPKVQSTNSITQKYKMIITYTSPKDAANAIQAFASSNLYADYQKKNVNLILTYFHSKENKIFVSGLKENTQAVVRESFQVFGEISEITLSKGKFNGILSAVIGFVNENDYKMALATYTEHPKILSLFNAKPHVTIFMNNQQKKSYNEMKKRQNQGQNQPQFFPQNRVPMMPYYVAQNHDQMGMNPQPRPMPMNQPGMIPPQNMNQPNKMPPPNMQPGMIPPNPNMNMGMGQMNQNFSRPQIPWNN